MADGCSIATMARAARAPTGRKRKHTLSSAPLSGAALAEATFALALHRLNAAAQKLNDDPCADSERGEWSEASTKRLRHQTQGGPLSPVEQRMVDIANDIARLANKIDQLQENFGPVLYIRLRKQLEKYIPEHRLIRHRGRRRALVHLYGIEKVGPTWRGRYPQAAELAWLSVIAGIPDFETFGTMTPEDALAKERRAMREAVETIQGRIRAYKPRS